MRAGGIWNLVELSDDPEAWDISIEEACNCQSGRLVITDNESGKTIEPEFEKSIVVIEYPPKGEHGPIWVDGGSRSNRRTATVRNPEPGYPLQVRKIKEQAVL